MKALRKADREGLDPADYDAHVPSKRPYKIPSMSSPGEDYNFEIADLELWYTYTFLRYGAHLYQGKVDPKEVDRNWHAIQRNNLDLPGLLEQALQNKQVEKTLSQLSPLHPEYLALREALAHYRKVAATGGWSRLPSNLILAKGDRCLHVAVLKRNLALMGDLIQEPSVSRQNDGNSIFDEATAEAVRRFESRHNLKEDGIVTPTMVAAMNVPVESRIRQIELNMERWRWLPDHLGDRHIRINIPDFELAVYETQRVAMTMRVVVGKKDNPTPIFSDQLTYVVFSPYWYIPKSIVAQETLPKIMKDRKYLQQHNIEVVKRGETKAMVESNSDINWSRIVEGSEYFLRQKPGPGNPLGRVKFMFPNHFSVYLHDTPTDELFDRLVRDYSHGCVRVDRPMDLVAYLFRDLPKWPTERVLAAMNAKEERAILLKSPLPVHILYWTAWIDNAGLIQFRKDLYGHDKAQEGAWLKCSRPCTLTREKLNRINPPGKECPRKTSPLAIPN